MVTKGKVTKHFQHGAMCVRCTRDNAEATGGILWHARGARRTVSRSWRTAHLSYRALSCHTCGYCARYHAFCYHARGYHAFYHDHSDHALSYGILGYRASSYHALSYHAPVYHALSYHACSYHAFSYHVKFRRCRTYWLTVCASRTLSRPPTVYMARGAAAPQGPQDCKPSTLNFHVLPLVRPFPLTKSSIRVAWGPYTLEAANGVHGAIQCDGALGRQCAEHGLRPSEIKLK